LQQCRTSVRPAVRCRYCQSHARRAGSGASPAFHGVGFEGAEECADRVRLPIMTAKHRFSRRSIMHAGALTAAVGFPAIVPSSVFGQNAPSNRITVGAIGVGRISRSHDLAAIRKYEGAHVIAVCDLDANRVEEAKRLVNSFYSTGAKPYNGVV